MKRLISVILLEKVIMDFNINGLFYERLCWYKLQLAVFRPIPAFADAA